tara:strand:+ start:31 stop:225 length:195 start_codon:yes stop_codon:yes gene_type:complete
MASMIHSLSFRYLISGIIILLSALKIGLPGSEISNLLIPLSNSANFDFAAFVALVSSVKVNLIS